MKGLNRVQIKYIAMAAMLIDHIGMMFFPVDGLWFAPILRVIGRITAPVMCYFLVEGFVHTSSPKKYLLRLGIFALVSQPAYSYAHYGALNLTDWNMIATLFISFVMLICYLRINNNILKIFLMFVLIVLSSYCDWGLIAPLWVLIFFVYKENKNSQVLGFVIVSIVCIGSNIMYMCAHNMHWYGELWQAGLFLAIPLLYLYNGVAGKKSPVHKWSFYLFYPLHLAVLGLIAYC